MNGEFYKILIQALGNLGMAGVFFYIYQQERAHSKKQESDLQEAYNENTKVIEGVKIALKDNNELVKLNKPIFEKSYDFYFESKKMIERLEKILNRVEKKLNKK